MSQKWSLPGIILLFVILALSMIPLPALNAMAGGPWYVTEGGHDGNDCLTPGAPCASINGAIGKASSGDMVYISIGTYTSATNEVALIDKNITLSGGWSLDFLTQVGSSVLDGEDTRRGLKVNSGVTAWVERVLIQHGSSTNGGGVLVEGTLALHNCEIDDNAATGTGNPEGGGVFVGSGATLKVNNSTISNNSAISGGGIFSAWGNVVLNNSTLSGNSANGGGGFNNLGGSASIYSSTLTDNSVSSMGGGGIRSEEAAASIANSIIAGNHGAYNPDCDGTITSLGYNIVGDSANCTLSTSTGDQIDIDPVLGILQDNGGPTPTHRLQITSPAIDQGNPSGCEDDLGSPLEGDQRGYPRDSHCDIGSYEYQHGDERVYLPCIISGYCAHLYRDRFDESGSGWPIGDYPEFAFGYNDGEYQILLKFTDTWVGVTSGIGAENYILEVELRNPSQVFGSYGLIFGLSEDWSEFYTFEIDPDGDYGLLKYDSGIWTDLASGQSSAILTGDAMNQLKLIRDGSSMEASVNGTSLADLTDGSYVGFRYLGLIGFSYDWANVDVRFDNFTVYPITCNPSSMMALSEPGGASFAGATGSWMSASGSAR